MKMAKIFAIMFAVVLAVFCLSGPFAFGGDEHPWDEEGGLDGGGLDGTNPDPDDGSDSPNKAGSSTVTPETQSDGSLLIDLFRLSLLTSTIF